VRVGSVRIGGRRRVARFDGDRVLVGESESLLHLLAAGRALDYETFSEVAADGIEIDAAIRPPILLCCGQNYSDHLAEQGHAGRKEPEFFVKAGQTIAAPRDPFVLEPANTTKLDYETELGVVIGRSLRGASEDEAAAAIFGYVVLNDLSARDRQIRENGRSTLGPGKNFDGATRLATSVITADEVPDPQALAISTTVNGELRQSNTTANMIYGCLEIVAFYSRALTLLPGTIVATGTPGGTGLGSDPELGGRGVVPAGCVPSRYLAPGDEVVSEVERVGSLAFGIVDSAAAAA
jgi:2-keto-4-pentenoate hydratase/2-oxohepta-3-ene-1,7-dioic acid hydratase in catechol pathway